MIFAFIATYMVLASLGLMIEWLRRKYRLPASLANAALFFYATQYWCPIEVAIAATCVILVYIIWRGRYV